MICKELNIQRCPRCIMKESAVVTSGFGCWVEWWENEFKQTNDIKAYIANSIRAEGFDEFHLLYLQTAIKQSHPHLTEYIDKISILL